MFDYDVAISFAGEQRNEAEAIADCLKKNEVKVFYADGLELLLCGLAEIGERSITRNRRLTAGPCRSTGTGTGE
jgi:hypothetical protein